MEQRVTTLEITIEHMKKAQEEIKGELTSLSRKVSAFLYVGIGIMISSGIISDKTAALLKQIFNAS